VASAAGFGILGLRPTRWRALYPRQATHRAPGCESPFPRITDRSDRRASPTPRAAPFRLSASPMPRADGAALPIRRPLPFRRFLPSRSNGTRRRDATPGGRSFRPWPPRAPEGDVNGVAGRRPSRPRPSLRKMLWCAGGAALPGAEKTLWAV